MYYGNPAAGAVQYPGTVWSEYELVYHFTNATGTTISDSSPNDNHGTSKEDFTPAAATLVTTGTGQGLRCDSAPAVRRYVDTNYRDDLTTWTVEAWVRADADPILNAVAGRANGPIMGGQVYNIGWDHNSTIYQGAIQLRDDVTDWQAAKLGTLTGGTWYYLCGVYNSAVPEAKAYNNGQVTATQSTLSGKLVATAVDVYIGVEFNTNNPIDGIVDEVRISAVPRSSDWIRAQYLSMTDAFITYGKPDKVP